MALKVNRLDIVIGRVLRCFLWKEVNMIELVGEQQCDEPARKALHERDVDLVLVVGLKVDESTEAERQHALG